MLFSFKCFIKFGLRTISRNSQCKNCINAIIMLLILERNWISYNMNNISGVRTLFAVEIVSVTN